MGAKKKPTEKKNVLVGSVSGSLVLGWNETNVLTFFLCSNEELRPPKMSVGIEVDISAFIYPACPHQHSVLPRFGIGQQPSPPPSEPFVCTHCGVAYSLDYDPRLLVSPDGTRAWIDGFELVCRDDIFGVHTLVVGLRDAPCQEITSALDRAYALAWESGVPSPRVWLTSGEGGIGCSNGLY